MNGLGRRIDPDERDRSFAMAPLLAVAPAPAPEVRTWRIPGRSLDQGATSTCVGHAWRNFIRCAPLQGEQGPSAWDIYRRAVKLDPWPDNDPEANFPDGDRHLKSGTSVRAGAKALQQSKHIESYLWAWDFDTFLQWLRSKGPIVIGTNWYDSLDEPDARGIAKISKTAKIVGGHAFLARGANVHSELILCENSWGEDWGSRGTFYLHFSDVERLINEEGEACTAIQTRAGP
jgi:hypothetical protein